MDLPEGTGLSRFLDQLRIKPELVVVELNLNILRREEVPGTVLKEGDQVEIVHFVGGGGDILMQYFSLQLKYNLLQMELRGR